MGQEGLGWVILLFHRHQTESLGGIQLLPVMSSLPWLNPLVWMAGRVGSTGTVDSVPTCGLLHGGLKVLGPLKWMPGSPSKFLRAEA